MEWIKFQNPPERIYFVNIMILEFLPLQNYEIIHLPCKSSNLAWQALENQTGGEKDTETTLWQAATNKDLEETSSTADTEETFS